MPISQTEDYFENTLYRFLEEPKNLSVGFKMETLRKSVAEC